MIEIDRVLADMLKHTSRVFFNMNIMLVALSITLVILDCGGMLSASSGAITSPNFKGQYPSNLDCRWLIHMPGKKIELSFPDFHTQQSYDRVEIYRGPKSTDKKWQWFSGVFKPYGSISTVDYMYVRFVTSAQNDQPYRGFRAVYVEDYVY